MAQLQSSSITGSLVISSSGTDSTTNSLLVTNGAGYEYLKITDGGTVDVRQNLIVNHATVSSRALRFSWGSIYATDTNNELTLGSVYTDNTATRIYISGKNSDNSPSDAISMQAGNGVAIFSGTNNNLFDPQALLHVSGSGIITGDLDVTGSLHVLGDITVGKISNQSKLVDVGGNFNFDTVAEPSTAERTNFSSSIISSAGNIDNGTHYYHVIYKTADGGETGAYGTPFLAATITDNTTAGQVQLTGIPTSSDARVTARDIYRTEAGDSQYYGKKLATISDNTTTTYTDNLADSSLDQDTLFYRKANSTAGYFYKDNNLFGQAGNAHYTSFGVSALESVTIGQDNVAFGGSALQNTTSGRENTAVGYSAGVNNTTGYGNTYLGYVSGYFNETGIKNTAVGSFALRQATLSSTSYNTAVGQGALWKLTGSNNHNTALGHAAGQGYQGAYNLHLGSYTGYKSTEGSGGDYNINIGYYTGNDTTGDNNILIGRQLEAPNSGSNNQLNIGNLIYATGLGLGGTLGTGNVGIGTDSPSEKLTVEGNISSSGNIRTLGAVMLDGIDGLHLNQGGASVFSPSPGIFYSSISGQGWYFQVPDNGQEKFSFKLGGLSSGREFRVVDPSWNPLFQVQGTGNAVIANNLTVGGTVTAQEFHTEFVSASIIYQSGSTKFGDTSDDTHSFTGSLHIQTSGSAGTNRLKLTTAAGIDVAALYNGNSNTTPVGNLALNYGSTGAAILSGQSNGLSIRGGYTTNGTIRFNSYLTEVMRVTGTGLGIGTTSPSAKFHLSDSNSTAGGTYATPFYVQLTRSSTGGSPSATYFTKEDYSLSGTDQFGNALGKQLYATIGNSGNSNYRNLMSRVHTISSGNANNIALYGTHFEGLGTGTISKFYGMVIGYTAGITGFSNVNSTITNTYGLYLGSLTSGTQTNDPYAIYQEGTEKIYLQGNVGIGTTTPNQKLHIQDGNLEVNPSGSGNYPWTGLNLGFGRNLPTKAGLFGASDGKVQYSDGNLYISTRNVNAGNGSYILLGQRDSDSATEKGTIILQAGTYNVNGQTGDILFKYGAGDQLTLKGSSSNVGIGTTSPNAGLEVANAENSTLRLTRSSNSGNYLQLQGGSSGAIYNINTSGTQDHIFQTGGNEKVRITSAGSVGIGTTTPEVKLDVRGQLLVAGDTPDARIGSTLEVYRNGSTAELSIHQDDSSATSAFSQLRFRNGGNDTYLKVPGNGQGLIVDVENKPSALVIDASGNVGIGTTSPQYPLHINNGTGDQSVLFESTDATNTIGIKDSSSTSVNTTGIGVSGDDLFLYAGSTAYNQRLRIQGSTGNVGIGITTPADKLHVYGNQEGITIQQSTSGNVFNGINFEDYNGVSNAGIKWNQSTGEFRLNTSTSYYPTFYANGSEAMRITTAGNVGIGTTSAGRKLTIAGTDNLLFLDSSGNSYLTIDRSATNRRSALVFSTAGDGTSNIPDNIDWALGSADSDEVGDGTGFFIGTNTAATSAKLFISSSGNVGIGTTSPSEKLAVNGNIVLGDGGLGSNLNFNSTDRGTIKVNGSERMRITSAGNVGINTTSPDQLLHVAGNAKMTNIYVLNNIIHEGDVDTQIKFQTDTIKFDTAGSERLIISSSGNIGIGTTSPSSKLHVSGAADVLLIEGSGSTANTSIFAIDGNNGRLFEVSDDLSDSLFSVNTIAGLPVMEVFADNRVTMGAFNQNDFVISGSKIGIGTGTPVSLLTLEGAVGGDPMLRLKSTGTPTSEDAYMAFNRDNTNNQGYTIGLDSGDNSFKISEDGDSITGNNRVTILTGGNVGIGTTSPDSLLELYSDSTTDFLKLTSGGATASPIKLIFEKTAAEQGIIEYNRNGDLEIYNSDNDGGVMINGRNSEAGDLYVADGGNVGIGTTSPSYKLDVSGSINHAGASYIVPATTSGASGATTVLTGATFDNATLIKASHDGVSTGNYTLELPAASSSTNRTIRIISDSSTDANHNVVIVPTSGDTLDGGTSGFTINRNYEGLMVWSDGTEWFVIQSKNV